MILIQYDTVLLLVVVVITITLKLYAQAGDNRPGCQPVRERHPQADYTHTGRHYGTSSCDTPAVRHWSNCQ